MRKHFFSNAKEWLVALLLVVATASFAQSSKDIMLYSTDFTDWTAYPAPSSNGTYPISDGAGKGFVLYQKPSVEPSSVIGPFTGYITNVSSSPSLDIKPLDFIAGGVVEIDYYVNQGSSTSVTLADADYVKFVSFSPDESMLTGRYDNIKAGGVSVGTKNVGWNANANDWFSGNKVEIRYDGFYCTVAFSLPASFKGTKTIKLQGTKQTDKLCAIRVYTSVGSTPYVASPTYPNAGADGSKTSVGYSITGALGGDAVNGTIDLTAYNLSGKTVNLSLIGEGASKFALDKTSFVAGANGAIENVGITFTPSVRAGNATAFLKLSADGASDYYINLLGITGGGTPEIVAQTALLNFWTYLIAPTTQVLDISGLNLTGDLTATIEGAGAGNFTLSQTSFTAMQAAKGQQLVITFTGDIQESELDANLVLSSAGAANVVVPLKGITTLLKQKKYSLFFEVSPSGTAYVDVTPGGKIFKEGTKVTATVTLEKGYKVQKWSDNVGSVSSSRTFVVSESKNTDNGTPIIIYTEKGQQVDPGPVGPTVAPFVALVPKAMDSQSITAAWTAQDGNSAGYDLTVKDESGTVVSTLAMPAGVTTYQVVGLEAGKKYFYEVSGIGTNGFETTNLAGPFTLPEASGTFVCGAQ